MRQTRTCGQIAELELADSHGCWSAFSDAQKDAYPNWRFLQTHGGSIQDGDLILLPGLPRQGFFSIAEVGGLYRFAPLAETKDHGHIRDVKLLTPNGINRFNQGVPAALRRTMRCQHRIWSLDPYTDEIGKLLVLAKERDLTKANSALERVEQAFAQASNDIRGALRQHLQFAVAAAEWEEPLKVALERLYPGAEVEWTAGPTEQGADLLIQIPNAFAPDCLPLIIPVQIADHTEEIGAEKLDQLRAARAHYSSRGTVIALALVTNGERFSTDFETARATLCAELGVPIFATLWRETADLMAVGFIGRSRATTV